MNKTLEFPMKEFTKKIYLNKQKSFEDLEKKGKNEMKKNERQAGAELCQAQGKLRLAGL